MRLLVRLLIWDEERDEPGKPIQSRIIIIPEGEFLAKLALFGTFARSDGRGVVQNYRRVTSFDFVMNGLEAE